MFKYNIMSLIPLGFHCNVTFLNQQISIKKETMQ
jgi:hypothetical protein